MRAYGFGEGLMAKATQPRKPTKGDQIAALRAENERLRAALEACITDDNAHCLQHQETPGAMARRIRVINDAARAALNGGAA